MAYFDNVLWIGTSGGTGGSYVIITDGSSYKIDYDGTDKMMTINDIIEFDGQMFLCGWGYNAARTRNTAIVMRRTGGAIGSGVWEQVFEGSYDTGGYNYMHQAHSLAIYNNELYVGGMCHKYWNGTRLYGRLRKWNPSTETFDFAASSNYGWTSFQSMYTWDGKLQLGDDAGPRIGYYDGSFHETLPYDNTSGISGYGDGIHDFIEYDGKLYAASGNQGVDSLWETSDGVNWSGDGQGEASEIHSSLETYNSELYIGTARESSSAPYYGRLLKGAGLEEFWRYAPTGIDRYEGVSVLHASADGRIIYIATGRYKDYSTDIPGRLYGIFGDQIVQIGANLDNSVTALYGDGTLAWDTDQPGDPYFPPSPSPPPPAEEDISCEPIGDGILGHLYVHGSRLIHG